MNRNLITAVAALTIPVLASGLAVTTHLGVALGLLVALLAVAAVRGGIDVLARRFGARTDLLEARGPAERESAAVQTRRAHFWAAKYRFAGWYLGACLLATLVFGADYVYWLQTPLRVGNGLPWMTVVQLPLLFAANFLIFMGPMMAMGISQVRGFEPGDASWGVELEHVRGQKDAKEEIRKVITLWESGRRFQDSGGKRERGVLFLGPPGVGKTMLAKAIATSFNCPIVTIPGSGFAQTFIGLDVVLVRWIMRKAKKLAAKWDGTCIVFIDEIDAVGMRRASLGAGGNVQQQMPGGMFGGMGQMGLNSLLVAMDGVDSPPFMKRLLVNKVNLWLDALYVFPRRVGRVPLRLPKAKPRNAEVYFIGATNVPIEALDPALTRAGRMGRHIYFRTPTKQDRADVFDLYLAKVKHDPALDTPDAREELARITQGYSPAEIEQACSLALTYAFHDARDAFHREDLLEAMVTLEMGTAVSWGYESADEELAVAVHEAGHAVCSHLYHEGSESVRLSVRKRGQTGGHHMSVEEVERFVKWRGELIDQLVWGLGAYAAEVAVYGQNSQGVGGDLQSASYLAATMVGRWGMPAPQVDAKDAKRLRELGKKLLAAAGPTDVKLTPDKQAAEAQIMGHAFLIAYNTAIENLDAIRYIAQEMCDRKEIFGDDVTELLENACLKPVGKDPSGLVWPEY